MIRAFAALAFLLYAGAARPHGGVSMEHDSCVLRIGEWRAHFTAYQPETRATQEFCESIPGLGRAVLVIDFVDAPLREQRVGFRMLRDFTGLGAATRFEDLGDDARREAHTLLALDPVAYPKGTLSAELRFEAPGWYIGLLSATDAGGRVHHSVFPFEVAVSHPWRYAPVLVLVAALSLLIWRLTGRNLPAAPDPNGDET